MKTNTKISVIGLGYIGFPTALVVSNNNFHVTGVDNNINLIDNLKKNKIHLSENEIKKFFIKSQKKNKIKFTTKPVISDIFIICVPTPLRNNKPDISSVLKAVESIYPVLKNGDTIIIESTCPVGTTIFIHEKINKFFKQKISFNLAYSPERVLPGDIFNEILNNDKIVGGINKPSTDIVANFFKKIINGKIYKTNSKMAELCKLVENSYRSLNIAFANELSLLCYKNSMEINTLIKLANQHKRVNILKPSIGVGGHCIPIDPNFLKEFDKQNTTLISLSNSINKKKTNTVKKYLIKKLTEFNKGGIKIQKIICLGLSYKPNVGDTRESPALQIFYFLKKRKKYIISAYDPYVIDNHKYLIKNFNQIRNQDVFIKLVDHSLFNEKKFLDLYKSKILIDLTIF